MAQLALPRQLELAHQIVGESVVPGGIERSEVLQEVAHRHPLGQFLVLRDVADLLELARPETPRIHFQHFAAFMRQSHARGMNLIPALITYSKLSVPVSIRMFLSILLP